MSESNIPKSVMKLAGCKEAGGKLPKFVFEDSVLALAFSWWLHYDCSLLIQKELSKKNLSRHYSEVLFHRLYFLSDLFVISAKVVRAWGWKPENVRVLEADIQAVRHNLYIEGNSALNSLARLPPPNAKIRNLDSRPFNMGLQNPNDSIKMSLAEAVDFMATEAVNEDEDILRAVRTVPKSRRISSMNEAFAVTIIKKMIAAKNDKERDEIASCSGITAMSKEELKNAFNFFCQEQTDRNIAILSKLSALRRYLRPFGQPVVAKK